MITPQDIMERLKELAEEAFPGEPVYLDLTPSDFERPSTLIALEDFEGEVNFSTGGIEMRPVITSTLSGNLGTKDTGFVVPYTVTDAEGGAVTVTERVENLFKRTIDNRILCVRGNRQFVFHYAWLQRWSAAMTDWKQNSLRTRRTTHASNDNCGHHH